MQDIYIVNEDCIISLVDFFPSRKRMTFSLTSNILSKTFFMRQSLCPPIQFGIKKINSFKHVYSLTLLAKLKNISLFRNLTHLSIGKKNNLECVSGLKNLLSLEIKSLRLTNVDILTTLTYIQVPLNNIWIIDSLTLLKKLDVSCRLYEINERKPSCDLNRHIHLQTLILPYQNNDTNIFYNIRYLNNLEYISCYNVDVFASGYNLQKLTYLSIDLNRRMPQRRFVGGAEYENMCKLFYHTQNLQQLELNYYVSTKIGCLQKLTHLVLTNVNIGFPLNILMNLKSLILLRVKNDTHNITNTSLERLKIDQSYGRSLCSLCSFVGNFALLTHLTIKSFRKELDLSCMLNLKELKITHEGKKFLNIHLLTKLTYLYIGRQIGIVKDIISLTNLIILDIGSNKINSLKSFVKLKKLYMSPLNVHLFNECGLTNIEKLYLARKNPRMLEIKSNVKIYT